MEKQQIARIVETILRKLESRGLLDDSNSNASPRAPETTSTSAEQSPPFDCGQVLTAEKVEKFERNFGKDALQVPTGTLVTSSARERAESLGVNLQTE